MMALRALWLAPCAILVALAFALALPEPTVPHPALPQAHEENGYLGSSACRACHPGEYESWRQTFHRSMTRRVSELSWGTSAAPQLPQRLELYGRTFRLKEIEPGRFGVRGPDLHLAGRTLPVLAQLKDASPDWMRKKGEEIFRSAPEVEREVVLTTGSHHYLAFWVEGGTDAELRQLPFVYFLRTGSWVPREEAFLQPPDALPFVARWNANCIQCHSVAGRPNESEGRDASGKFWQKYESQVAEFGISCEACHGPGAQHTQHFQNPLRRVAAHQDHDDSKTAAYIFNPGNASAKLGSEACGQCHSYFLPADAEDWWENGFSNSYEAGLPLSGSRTVINADDFQTEHSTEISALAATRESLFWDDGSMIVGGREYNGLIKSPCFEHTQDDTKMSCVSCHSMHNSDPNRQIAARFSSRHTEDKMCTQCHDSLEKTHSRHEPDSTGARCVSCHMPRTSYALLQGTRSHRISSPRAEQTSPPNACALCHVNQTRAWFTAQLAIFGDQSAAWPAPGRDAGLPWAAELSLAHNAVTRALMADALGREETLAASGVSLSRQLLPLLLQDEYAAVRHIARRSSAQLEADSQQLEPAHETRLPSGALLDLLKRQDTTPTVISE